MLQEEVTSISQVEEEKYVPDVKCCFCGEDILLEINTYAWYDGAIRCRYCLGLFRARIGAYYRGRSGGREATLSTTMPVPGRKLRGGRLLGEPVPISDKGRLPPEIVLELTKPWVPDNIRQSIWSAHRAYETEDYLSAAVMCRFAVQAALLHIGIEDKSAVAMVEEARNKSLLGELVARECGAAIFIGGKAAHPQSDSTMVIGAEDVLVAFSLVAKIIKELFLKE